MLIPIHLVFTYGLTIIVSILIGYALGRNSAGQPIKAVPEPQSFDPGPTEVPEGNLFRDCLKEPVLEDRESRIKTI